MSVTVNARELVNTLNKLKPGLSAKESIEQSDSYIFYGGKIITFNDEIMVMADFDIGFNGTVHAKSLDDVLKKMKSSDVDIKVTSDKMLSLSTGKTNAVLNFSKDILSPIKKFPTHKGIEKLPENFTRLASLACQTTSKDLSSPITMCVHLSNQKIEALDNFRITQCHLSDADFGESSLVLAKSLSPILKEDLTHHKIGNKWIYFYDESGCIYSVRKYASEYPDLDEFFNEGNEVQINLPDDFSEILNRTDTFAKKIDGDDTVNVSIKKNTMVISSSNEYGTIKETAKLQYNGESFSFSTGPHLLKNIMNFVGSDGNISIIEDSWLLKISNHEMGVEHLVKLD